MDLKGMLRTVPDFPREGINFIDITPLMKAPDALRQALSSMERFASHLSFDAIAAPEARGFLVAAPLAVSLGVPFIPVRKPGKLPAATLRGEYQLEYGEAALEIHADALSQGSRVLVVDDLLATGGTVAATRSLVERLGGSVAGFAFLVELTFLGGRSALSGCPVFSVVQLDH